MTYYVRRTSKHNAAGVAWVGPLPESRAWREADAWEAAGEEVLVLEADAETRREVRRWEKVTHAADAREVVTFQGEAMTLAAYRLFHEERS